MQKAREVEVTTALDERLIFRRMTGHEELGRPFVYELELLSQIGTLDLEKVVGHPAAVRLDLQSEAVRHFHGVVTQFGQHGTEGNYHPALRIAASSPTRSPRKARPR
jgi:type VI secretion system secreted protein VgrG